MFGSQGGGLGTCEGRAGRRGTAQWWCSLTDDSCFNDWVSPAPRHFLTSIGDHKEMHEERQKLRMAVMLTLEKWRVFRGMYSWWFGEKEMEAG